MSFDLSQIAKASLVLFAVIDIIGSIPIILQVRQKAGHVFPLRATLVSLGIMVTFLFAGEKLLGVFGVDVHSFAVAGSFILFFLALEMILGIHLFKEEKIDAEEEGISIKGARVQSIVPLAFPVIAGAGTITTILSLRAEFELMNILVAIVLNMVVVFGVLHTSSRIGSLLGQVGIIVLKKAFGVILLAIAVKLFGSNVGFLFDVGP
jgi:multiple antibiotic resistance protein